MFSGQLPDNEDYRVIVGAFATRYFLKRFAKEYKGKRWDITFSSVEQDLRRVHALQSTQQVDELKRGPGCVLFKYDFAIAQSNVSPKASGNRCIVFLDTETHVETILTIYSKTDLPKNRHETDWVLDTVKNNYNTIWERLD